MSENGRRYIFKGHAVGVAAQFHRLGDMTGLNHLVPAVGAAVLPVTGGLSHSNITDFDYPVEQPWKRSLVSAGRVESKARGSETPDGYHTEVHCKIEQLHVLEKLHFGIVELHLSSRKTGDAPTEICTTGNRIEGMRLGVVDVTVILDEDTLAQCGTKRQLADFYAAQDADFRRTNAWRFRTEPGATEIQEHDGYYLFTLVREIRLSGPPDEVKKIPPPVGNKIHWPGFGRIYLAEVLVGERERRLTMARLDMGSDAVGSGSIGDAGTNGSVSM